MTSEQAKAAARRVWAAQRSFQASAAGNFGWTLKLYAIAGTLMWETLARSQATRTKKPPKGNP